MRSWHNEPATERACFSQEVQQAPPSASAPWTPRPGNPWPFWDDDQETAGRRATHHSVEKMRRGAFLLVLQPPKHEQDETHAETDVERVATGQGTEQAPPPVSSATDSAS